MPVPWFDRDPKKTKQETNLVLTLFLGSLALIFFPLFLLYFLLRDGKNVPQKILLIVCILAVSSFISRKIEGINILGEKTPENSASESIENVLASSDKLIDKAYDDALESAMRAAEETQTAKTASEWEYVAALWRNSITQMKLIPESHEKYHAAQQKAVEYEPNLEYALRNMEKAQEIESIE